MKIGYLLIFLREISSPDQASADARRFHNETSFAQLGASLVGERNASSQLSGKESEYTHFSSKFDCVGGFILISSYIFPLCSYDHEMILKWIRFKFKMWDYFLKQKTLFWNFQGTNWVSFFTIINCIYDSGNTPLHPLPCGLSFKRVFPHVALASPREIWSNHIFATEIWSLENWI